MTPTQRDQETAAEVDLKICDKCGWYDTFNHASRCAPERGAAAQRLIAAVPDVRAGQLGYGSDRVVFDISEDFSIVFECGRRSFSFSAIHLLGNLDEAAAADLVRVLKTWADKQEKPTGRTNKR